MMTLHSTLLLLMGHLLYSHLVEADLMDLISEATCAARCFNLFSHSLTGRDKIFLQQHPELTQPHCINQKGACALCLDVCQWPRSQTVQCSESCQNYIKLSGQIHLPNSEQTCMEACAFARDLYTRVDHFNRGQVTPRCPRAESWPPVCGPHCRSDADCPSNGLHKCCPTTVCGTQSNAPANHTWTQICTPGILTTNGVPFVPARPSVKQLDNTITNSTDLNPGQGTHQLELDWLNYYNITQPKANGWGPSQYPAVFLIQLRLFDDPSATIVFEDPSSPELRGPNVIDPTLFADRLFDEWRGLVWTTKLGAVLSDLRPGTWYQFRLLAISSAGYGGWGEPSRPIKILTRPIPPSSPRNLTETRSRISENVVDVTIQWQPPLTGNLPLKKYQITWRRYYGFNGGDRGSYTEYEANVPGDKTVYLIENLEPATSYKIEVKAVSLFEGKELPSHPITLYITTLSIPERPVASTENIRLLSPNETCRCDSVQYQPIKIGDVFYENQQLKAHLLLRPGAGQPQQNKQYLLVWGPRVCIETRGSQGRLPYQSHEKIAYGYELMHFELTQLYFQCHYKVTLSEHHATQSAVQQRPRTWQACFCTPPCYAVSVRTGAAPANCTNTASFGTIKPMKLSYKLIKPNDTIPNIKDHYTVPLEQQRPELNARLKHTSNEHYDAVVQWQTLSESTKHAETRRRFRALPTNQEPDRSVPEVRGIRITWGPRVYEPVAEESYYNGLKPHLDPEQAQSKVVDPRHSSLLLRRLQPNTLYIVHVQSISEGLDGPVSTIFFSSPNSNIPSSTARCRQSTQSILLCLFVIILLHTTYQR